MNEPDFLRAHKAVLEEEEPEGQYHVYRLKSVHDEDVKSVSVSFYRSRLLKVDVEFTEKFVRSTDWFDLVERFSEKYGYGRLTQLEHRPRVTDMVDWTDDQTHLILRHVWQMNGNGGSLRSSYQASYVDNDFYVESLRAHTPVALAPLEEEKPSRSRFALRN